MTNRHVYEPHEPSFPSKKTRIAFYCAKFNTEFPTEADCIEELYKRADTVALPECRHCGASILNKQYGGRVSRCQNCARQTWHTAGTFFEGIRLAKAWLGAIWLMERGVALSSSEFHKCFGIAQSTALNILHKVRAVIRKHMDGDAPTVSSAVFCGLFRKRSLLTPAQAHPRAEQEETERASLDNSSRGSDANLVAGADMSLAADIGARYFGPVNDELNQAKHARDDCAIGHAAITGGIPGGIEDGVPAGIDDGIPAGIEDGIPAGVAANGTAGFSGHENEIYDLLSEKPMAVDTLCQLTGRPASELSVGLLILELSKLASRLPGDYYVRCQSAAESNVPVPCNLGSDSESASTMNRNVAAAINFIIEHCHGISRKYLQNYLAAFWCYSDRKTWLPGSLLKLCRQSAAIKDAEILGYVSPPMVKVLSGSYC